MAAISFGLLRSGDATAQDEAQPGATLGGYQGTAASSGLHALYYPDGLLPTGPPVDVGAPDALTTISSGPSTFARAAVTDPGDLLYNPDALLSQGGAGWEPGTLPPYPYRAVARSDTGAPEAESNPSPGLTAKVRALPERATARATMPGSSSPAVATLDSLVAESTAAIDGPTVTVRSYSKAGGFDLLGLVKIDSIVTDIAASSEGGATTLTGGTTITGASVLGMPVTIDAEGVHATKETQPATDPLNAVLPNVVGTGTTSLNDTLAAAGLRVTLAGPVQLAGGHEGQLASSGLRIDLELSEQTTPLLTQLANAVPAPELVPGAPGIADVLQLMKTRHLVSMEVGRGQVSLTAREAGELAPPADPGNTGAALTPGIDTSIAPSVDTGSGTSIEPAAPPSEGLPQHVANRSAPFARGIGVFVLLALVAQLLIGDRLAGFTRSFLAPSDGSACPREGL